jgi:hypothetical protein
VGGVIKTDLGITLMPTFPQNDPLIPRAEKKNQLKASHNEMFFVLAGSATFAADKFHQLQHEGQ